MNTTFSTEVKTTNNHIITHKKMRREFIWHLFSQGFKAVEIADIYQVPVSSVRTIIRRRAEFKPVIKLEKALYYRNRTAIMEECLSKGYNVKQIANYFGFHVNQVYVFCNVKSLLNASEKIKLQL